MLIESGQSCDYRIEAWFLANLYESHAVASQEAQKPKGRPHPVSCPSLRRSPLKGLLLLGAGGHGNSTVDLVEQTNAYEIRGILDSLHFHKGSLLDYPILGTFDQLESIVPTFPFFLVSVGQIGLPALRRELFERAQATTASSPVVCSPHSYVSSRAQIGGGTAVFPGAVINANAVVGENVIVNSQSLIEHDVTVGSHSHISTGAKINGGVRIGENCFVGSGAVIFQEVAIPAGSVVPAGTIVKSWPL